MDFANEILENSDVKTLYDISVEYIKEYGKRENADYYSIHKNYYSINRVLLNYEQSEFVQRLILLMINKSCDIDDTLEIQSNILDYDLGGFYGVSVIIISKKEPFIDKQISKKIFEFNTMLKGFAIIERRLNEIKKAINKYKRDRDVILQRMSELKRLAQPDKISVVDNDVVLEWGIPKQGVNIHIPIDIILSNSANDVLNFLAEKLGV